MQIAPTASDLIGRPPVAETPSGGGRFLPKDRDRRRGLCRSRHLENPPAPPTVPQYKVARFDDPAERANRRRPKRSTRSLVRAFASSSARASRRRPRAPGRNVAPASGRRGGATRGDASVAASPRCDPPPGSSFPRPRGLAVDRPGRDRRGGGALGRSPSRSSPPRSSSRPGAPTGRGAGDPVSRYAEGGGGRSRIVHGITTPQSPQ